MTVGDTGEEEEPSVKVTFGYFTRDKLQPGVPR